MPKMRVRYVSSHVHRPASSRRAPHYGEIWYELGGRQAMSRATTAEAALETIYAAGRGDRAGRG